MMSSTLTAKFGSVEILKLLTRCGLRACSAEMHSTLVWLMPISLAMVRTLQCVALTGRSFTAFSTTLSLIAALIGFLPGGLERPFTSPSTPASAKYSCQRHTVVLETPNLSHDRHDAMTIRRHEDDPCAFDDLLWSVSIGNQLLQLQSSLPLEHKSRLVMFHPRNEPRSHKGFKCS